MHKVLVNCLVKLAQGKTDGLEMTIAFGWDVKQETKQNKIKRMEVFLLDFFSPKSKHSQQTIIGVN